MKNLINFLIFLVCASYCLPLHAQDSEVDTIWHNGGVGSLQLTNTGYSNYWQGGGINSFSIAGRINLFANMDKEKHNWQNDLDLALGYIRQGNEGDFIKNDDRIELNSKYGFKITDKLLLSTLLGLRTQFVEGFLFDPNAAVLTPVDTVSEFFSPAYVNFGIGLDYQPSKQLSIYYTPLNSKITIVTNEDLRPLYIPQNITTGAVRYEMGSLLAVRYRRTLADNLTFLTRANFFGNYLQNVGNIDINWETLSTLKINSWLAVTFATLLIYDDDINFEIDEDNDGVVENVGPRTQFQHILSIGLTYNLNQYVTR